MSFLLASAARATTGARSGQEDAFRVWPDEGVARPKGEDGGLLAVLADGMGGHTGGAIAGQTACSTFADVFVANGLPYDQRLETALHASNEAIAKGVEQNAGLRGMGCTLIGAWMDDLGIRWTSVGDSLLLLYRFPDVIRLNADHSLGFFLDEQARQNRISAAEAKQHHNRNALRSALTGAKIDLIDLRSEPLELRAGDWILLASDGICSLEGDEIADIVYSHREAKPEVMAQGLIDAVIRKGVAGQDNTTVVAVRVEEAPVEGAVTTRGLRRGGDDVELRSRRIGITGRKTSLRGRPGQQQSMRSVVWFAAAAMVFLVVAALVLLRSLQSTTPPAAPEAAIPIKPQPTAVGTPEPATSDTPGPSSPDPARPQGPPSIELQPPITPKPASPEASNPPGPPPAPKTAPTPPPKRQPAVPVQRATPTSPPAQTAPSDGQAAPTAPPVSPSPQSGGVQSEDAPHTDQTKQQKEGEQQKRNRRPDQQGKDAPKAAPKEAKESKQNLNKGVTKGAPKEGANAPPKQAAKQVLPWGFGP